MDSPFILSITWPHGEVVSLDEGVSLLRGLRCRLSRSVDPEIVERSPQVMEVWAEAFDGSLGNFEVAAGALIRLRGTVRFTPQTVTWAADSQAVEMLPLLLERGAHLLVRVHCGTISDEEQRPFSAALDAITGLQTLHLPGGVFESWFDVVRG